MMNIVIAFCGQIRTPNLFLRSIEKAKYLFDSGLIKKVILSTWDDEIGRYPEVAKALNHPAFDIVSLFQPDDMGVSHSYFRQMRLLHGALRHIETDALVFKTRPDIFFDLEAVPSLARHVLNTPLPKDIPHIFERRVWVAQFEATSPFYINDIVFLGTRLDIMKLCNFDMSFELNNFFLDKSNHHITPAPSSLEIRRFIHPFLNKFPILEEYNEVFHMSYGGQPNRKTVLQYNYSNAIYCNYLSVYFYVMKNYFLVGKPFYDGKFHLIRREEPTPEGYQLFGANHYTSSVNPNEFIKNFTKNLDGFGLLYCNGHEWIENIMKGAINDPEVRRCIHETLPLSLDYSPTPERREAFSRYRKGLIEAAGLTDLLS